MTKLLNQPSTGIVVLVALLLWDNKKEEEQLAQIIRDETLSRLPLRLSTNRVVELVQLRDTARPVSITSSPWAFFYLCLVLNLCCYIYVCVCISILIRNIIAHKYKGKFLRKEWVCYSA